MKIIKYNLYSVINHGTEEEPQIEETLYPVTMPWDEVNERIAKQEAYNGEYTIEDDGVPIFPVADRNILSGEYVTINGVLYKAIANIPNGGYIITGQNAVVTTVEEQLYELKKGE